MSLAQPTAVELRPQQETRRCRVTTSEPVTPPRREGDAASSLDAAVCFNGSLGGSRSFPTYSCRAFELARRASGNERARGTSQRTTDSSRKHTVTHELDLGGSVNRLKRRTGF